MEREAIQSSPDENPQLSTLLKGMVRAILNATPSAVLKVIPGPQSEEAKEG
jgi:hypothetical protein